MVHPIDDARGSGLWRFRFCAHPLNVTALCHGIYLRAYTGCGEIFMFSFIRNAGMVAVLAVFVVVCAHASAQTPFGTPNESSAFSVPEKQLIQPAELNSILTAKSGEKPLMFQVGSRVLFEQAHIAGSEYTGPGSQQVGLDQLKKRVASLSKDKAIVLYCGCCPWNRCPNVGPAFKLLQSLGFTQVRVLYFANNFGSDWAEKGYPVARGQ
jgi:thiosulfate/3-mercaptopyruvate sulfurtransferase